MSRKISNIFLVNIFNIEGFDAKRTSTNTTTAMKLIQTLAAAMGKAVAVAARMAVEHLSRDLLTVKESGFLLPGVQPHQDTSLASELKVELCLLHQADLALR